MVGFCYDFMFYCDCDVVLIWCVFVLVSDKIDLFVLVGVFVDVGVEIVFIGLMVVIICDVGFVVIDVVVVIGVVEMFDGWVKMLYFKIYGGLFVDLCFEDYEC